ncbi:MAG: sialate O-acetylesterase [Pirellulales bacterium]|nr:sialate O-acetylesterase [Pirellulales bacterium]
MYSRVSRQPLLGFAFLLTIAICYGVTSSGKEPVSLPAKKTFHIYLLMGQSNMAGRGKVGDDNDKSLHPHVLVLNRENVWSPASDPLHFDKPTAGVGPGLTFGLAMAENNPSITIGLVPCAVGDTPLSRWVKGGDLFQVALKRAKVAQQHGTLKGIIWHQGENDSADLILAKTYGDRLDAMITDLRRDLDSLDLPFVVGQLGEFISTEQLPYSNIVNKALTSLPERIAATACVESKGLKSQDLVHFDAASAREFGYHYAEAMQKLQYSRDGK